MIEPRFYEHEALCMNGEHRILYEIPSLSRDEIIQLIG